ncbi:DUF1983 domain-containing protein [Pseudomonas putida]|uniref:phage tail tip fiber protein n=1 Tax=Pseudomonas putida TaxID=303 RepID=UPI00125F5A5D|nr:DUF1983 domain-containing protein [Pseudomonas putida]KAB5626298.1 DUF1983 domain-containing protein [Pseudomonas putida]
MSGGVRKIAQIAVGAVIGFAQGGPIGAAIGAGLAFYASEQQEKLNTKSPLRDNEPSAQTVRSSKAPARFILGRVSTGGVLVWAQEEAGAQRDGEWLHLVYVLCEGAIDALEEIYLGEELINTYGADATYELVVNPTQVNAFLKANCPDWKDEQIGRGLSFVRLSLRYNAEKFPSGIPDARFVVRGRNDLYDPRTGMAGYSENTALHILWFLRTRCGVPDDEIVFETFASGANVCDESVANPDGTTSPRYRSSCVIGADEQRTNVLQKLEASCGGKVIRVGGRWMFQAGAYYGPWDFEITEDMVIGTITGSTEPTNDAAINTIRGTFTDTTQSWTETDYPEVSVAEWVVEDGGEAAETLTFSYVTNPYQAQRLANIELRRRRAGGVINVPLNLLGYNCRPGRAVRANLPSLNILGEFIVTGWSMGTSEGCTASLQVYGPAIFDDAVGKPYNPIGFINLPSGGLGSPTGLAWTVDDTAEVTQGVLSWERPFGIVTGFAVTVRQAGVAVQAQQVPETTLQVPLAGLPSGNYTMSVAALGPQARSGEASITVNINGPAVPEGCTVTSTIESINLAPSNIQHGLNGGTYEYFFSMDPQATAAQAEYLGQGLSLTHTGLAFFTNYYYFIRSKNAYGVSGFLKIVASTSTDVTAMLAALAGKIERTQLGQELTSEIDGLQDQINALDGLKAYDPESPYTAGQMVVVDGRIYQAVHDVAADPEGGNAPPNPLLWIDVGQSIESANGLAQQVQTNTAKIEEVDGKAVSTASQVNALQAAWRDDDGAGELAGAIDAWDTKARFASEVKVVATESKATARKTETMEVVVGETQAQVQVVTQAQAELDGKASTMWAVKMELNAQGQYVAAGIGLGIENGPAGLQSQFLVNADRFAVVNNINGTLSSPFVVQGGQVFINQAFINSAYIQTIVNSGTLRSQAVDAQGRPLIELNMVTGVFTFRGQDASGSVLINNGGIYVYDANGIERAALGRMT